MADQTTVVGLARRQAKARPAGKAGPPATPADAIAQLKDLAALKERGILTEEEFTALKARILGP
jgi:hypothetical protein